MRGYAMLTAAMALVAVSAGAAETADPGRHVNLKGGGGALHGYDPVAYVDRGRAVPGTPAFTATYEGVRYQFADTADKASFTAAPARYLPAYGGFCAYGVAQGFKVDVDPEAFSVVGGRLYLNVSKSIRAKWQKDVRGYVRKADADWPTVRDKKSGVLGGLFG